MASQTTNTHSTPTYPKLFQDSDYYSVDPARSVLSPAAYFVELMDLVDNQIIVDTNNPEAVTLKERRKDLWDIVLDYNNTYTETPKLNQVITLLEEYLTSNNVSFVGLSGVNYPFDLPFEKHLTAIRKYLKQSNLSLSELWTEIAYDALPSNASNIDNYVNLDRLGLSPAQWYFYSTPKTDVASLNVAYGLSSDYPVADLSNANLFMEQCGINRTQLNELINQDLNTTELNAGINAQFFINMGSETAIEVKNDQIFNLTADRLDCMHRFIRLSNALNWSYPDLNWALYCTSQCNGQTMEISSDALPNLAWASWLQTKGLTFQQSFAMVWELKNYGLKDGTTPFQQVFENPNVPDLLSLPSSTIKWDPTQLEYQNELSSVLGLSHEDLATIGSLFSSPITLDNAGLAQLYQLSLLPKLTGFSLKEVMTAADILPKSSGKSIKELLGSGGTENMAAALEALLAFSKNLKASPLSLTEIQFIITGETDDPAIQNSIPSGDTLTNFTKELKSALEGTFFEPDILSESMHHTLTEGLTEALNDAEFTNGLTAPEKQSLHNILKHQNSYVDDMIAFVNNGLTYMHICVHGMVIKSNMDNTIIAALLQHAIHPVLNKISSKIGQTPTWTSTKWQGVLSKNLVNYHNIQEQTILNHLAGVCQLTPTRAKSLKSWGVKYLQAQQSGTTPISWLSTVVGLVSGTDMNKLTDLLTTLQRVAYLINNFALSHSEATYFLNEFEPSESQSITWNTLKEINNYKTVTGTFSDTQNTFLDMLNGGFSLANTEQLEAFVDLTGWNSSDLTFLSNADQYPEVAEVTIANTNYLMTYFGSANSLGIDAKMLWNLIKLSPINAELSNPADNTAPYPPNPLDETVAHALFGGLQSILGTDSSALTKIEHEIKGELRDKLVALSMKKLNITSARDLFSYFLIDVQIDGSIQTSKVREAISAVQLYIHRCLNHMEPGVTFSSTVTTKIQTLWNWMYSYREWLTNREVFLFPENYIEPELRNDTSPEFANLVNQVRQIDRTDPGAYKTVFKNYFKDFVKTANIEVLSIAEFAPTNPEPTNSEKKFFMVGRTQQDPTEYYYRMVTAQEAQDSENHRCLSDLEWGYWQKIGGHMHPLLYNDRVPGISPKYVFGKWYLFWLEQEMSSSTTSSSTTPNTTSTSYSTAQNYKAKCKYISLDADENWSPVQTGASFDTLDLTSWASRYLTFTQSTEADSDGKYTLTVSCQLNLETGDSTQSFELKGYVYSGSSQHIWTFQQTGTTVISLLNHTQTTPIQYPTTSAFLPVLESYIQQKHGVEKLFSAASTSNSGACNDLASNIPITNYYWELLFHAPFLIAHELQTHQQFIEAKKWYEYIFNPQQVMTSEDSGNDRFWRFPGLRSSVNPTLANETARTETQDQIHNLVATSQVNASETDPFDPHAIARLRPIAYQKTVFAHYLRNLQAWGDQCMIENTHESLNEAELIYVMTADLLGQKPEDLGEDNSRPSTNYNNVGGNWIPLTNSGQSSRPRGITCISKLGDDIWAGTGGEGLWLTTDQGATWTAQTDAGFQDNGTTYSLGSNCNIIAIESTPLRVFVLFKDNFGTNVLFYKTQGGSWEFGFTPDNKVLQPYSLVLSNEEIFVGDHNANIFQFDLNAHNNWNAVVNAPTGQSNPIDILVIHGNDAYFFAGQYYKGAINGGTSNPPTVIPNTPSSDKPDNAVLAFDGINIIAGSKLSYSSDGSNWSIPTLPDGFQSFTTNKLSWLVLCLGSGRPHFYSSTDMGQSWSKSPEIIPSGAHQTFSIGETFYLSQDGSGIYQSVDNGYSWQSIDISNGGQSFTVMNTTSFFKSIQHLYIGSDSLWYITLPYFEAPQNLQMLGYWDSISQRLYDVNHGLTLDGVPDLLPLFSSQYGIQNMPALALSAESLESELGSGYDTVPHYRFSYMIDKAKAACDNLRSLGSALLSAMENKDASALSNLYIQNEQTIQSINLQVKRDQMTSALSNLNAIEAGQTGIEDRINHYRQLINGGLISDEITQVGQKAVAISLVLGKMAFNIAAAYGYLQPKIFGLADGGMDWGKSIDKPGSVLADIATTLEIGSDIAGIHAEHSRREAEWNDQWQVALNDLAQVQHQINAASHTLSAVKNEMTSLETDLIQKQKVAQFYLHKFTNEQLYQWFITQISTLYFQSYQMALDLAVQADNARKFEQNITSSAESFISPGYWNNLHQGLLAGEKLHQDLQRMEKHYMDHNARPLFIEKEISLSSLDQFAFVNLISTGSCVFDITEKDYDFDFPGHYNRRIVRVSIYVELQDGVSGHINATLTQLTSKIIASDDAANGTNAAQYLLNPYSTTNTQGTKLATGNNAFISNLSPGQSVIMSQGPTDPVMLMIYGSDNRYLPFEGTGAVSSWMLEMPFDNNALDLTRIKDVKMHINYSAYSGNAVFKKAITQSRGAFQGLQPMAMSKAFPEVWGDFVKSNNPQALSFDLDPRNWRANGVSYTIDSIMLLAIAEEGTTIPPLSLVVPDDSGGNKTVSFEASPNTSVQGTVPVTGGSSSTSPYTGSIAANKSSWILQSTSTSGSASGKQAKMPKGLKEILISIEFSVTFPASS